MKIRKLTMAALASAAMIAGATPAHAGTDAYLGEILLVGFTYCPRGTIEANGQLLPISQYSALFSLYGTTYGGDGRTAFALPDLRGRVPMHLGKGPRVSDDRQDQSGGVETGGNQGQSKVPPYLVMRYCVVTQGIYPPRN